MKQTVMLKKNYEFKIVLTKGRFYIGKQLKIVILKNGKNFKTLGIAVSTKNGKAFQRNKAKRLIREAYKNIDIVIGGVEASLRRMAHYDYWGNNVRNSILIDSGAE